VREHAAQWNIDPKRVGMVGFSAGAMQALQVSLSAQPESRPAFVGLIYGPLAPATVPNDAPPLFAALAADDPLVGAAGFGLIDSWKNAHRPVEFHLYQHGGHGFGMRGKDTTALWPEEFLAWIKANGFLSK
jgi:acetyl esterase/lipase